MITGKTLMGWGYAPGAWFKDALAAAVAAERAGESEDAVRALVAGMAPPPITRVPMRSAGLGFHLNIRAENDHEAANIAAVERHMTELMRVPTIVAGAVMPDACPTGSAPGTIPVGGVIAAKDAIHPGMHSADICCSMAVSIFSNDVEPATILDAGMRLSHFGGGGRPRGEQLAPADSLLARFVENPFLKGLTSAAIEHHATQGDGNHFLYVGRLQRTGQLALVTHHGSRKPGAMLYKAGMAAAEAHTSKVSPDTPRHNAWIDAESDQGRSYWEALQIVREWTKSNHFAIHGLVARTLGLKIDQSFWNEHNFVFRRSDGLYYHGKGATPAWADFAADSSGLTLIPMNMAEPILIARGADAARGLGFAPHGAGRNFSRTAYMRSHGARSEAEVVAEQTAGIDARFFSGHPDLSELPGAYKSAASVRAQIEEYGLAEIVDTIEPIGCIMAGEWDRDAPWKQRKRKSA